MYRANDDALFRIDAQGNGERPFLPQAWPAVDPAFGPDGRVAFARRRTEVRDVSAIWLAATSGANGRAITRGPGLQVHPTWSGDGAWIVFEHSRRAQGTDLRRVSPDGAANELLLEGKPGEHNQKPAFSPDGRRLAYSSSRSGNFDIWTLDPASAGGAGTQLTDAPALDRGPAWSPDSASLAFTTQRRGVLEVWVMAADGSGQRPLFESDGPAAEPAWR